jgi:hypothetical protein
MAMPHYVIEYDTDEAAANRQTASLGGLAIALLVVVVSVFLVRELRLSGAIQWGTQQNYDGAYTMPGAPLLAAGTVN